MRHLPYGLGLIIPCVIILTIGAGVWLIYLPRLDTNYQNWWLAGYAMVWLSYAMAIFTPPGSPTRGKMQPFDAWCIKCNAPKPERAHHCKQCKRCILKMDHHCPWTANCVGHNNLPHFFRFLAWVVGECCFSFFLEVIFIKQMWNEPAYLYTKKEMAFAIFVLLLTAFIIFSVGILLLRVVYNLANGASQIEVWEQERVAVMARRKLSPREPFPFDVDFGTNLYTGLGSFVLWMWPFGRAPGNGEQFPKLFSTTKRWPPVAKYETKQHEFYKPENWFNEEGEDLEFFGVDPSAECDEEDIPLAARINK